MRRTPTTKMWADRVQRTSRQRASARRARVAERDLRAVTKKVQLDLFDGGTRVHLAALDASARTVH